MKKILILVWCAAVLALSCNPMRKLERKVILKRMAALESFAGSYVETGISARAQETQIYAQRYPTAILARVLSDGPAKGSILQYAKGSLALYFPQSRFGIRYSHLRELNQVEETKWLESEYDWHIAHYDISLLEDASVAGHSTKQVLYAPKADFAASPFAFTWTSFAESDFAFALKMRMQKNGIEKYQIEFKTIEFQKQLTEKDLAFGFPAGTTVAEYNLASKKYSLAEANAGSNFKITLPKDGGNFQLTKIIRVQGLIPAFTAYYERLPYQTYYTQVRDYGLRLMPQNGITVEGKRKYRVLFAGAFRTVYFLEKGVYHSVVSSEPLSEVLAWLDGLST